MALANIEVCELMADRGAIALLAPITLAQLFSSFNFSCVTDECEIGKLALGRNLGFLVAVDGTPCSLVSNSEDSA